MKYVPYRNLAEARRDRAADRAERQRRGLRYVGLVWVPVTVTYGDGEFVRREPMQLYRERTGDTAVEYVRWGLSDYRPRWPADTAAAFTED